MANLETGDRSGKAAVAWPAMIAAMMIIRVAVRKVPGDK